MFQRLLQNILGYNQQVPVNNVPVNNHIPVPIPINNIDMDVDIAVNMIVDNLDNVAVAVAVAAPVAAPVAPVVHPNVNNINHRIDIRAEMNMLRALFENNDINNAQRQNQNQNQNPNINQNHSVTSQFKPDKNGSNIIKTLKPKDNNLAHFDNINFPNEIYIVTFMNNTIEEKKAADINDYTLNVKKTVFDYNIKINSKLTLENLIPTTLNGIIYTRSSIDNGTSIDTQKQAMLDYALKNNMILDTTNGYIEDNNVSGRTNLIKGEISFWLPQIKDNSHLIIYSTDRFTRNMLHGLVLLDDMVKRNITVHFLKEEIVYDSNVSAAKKAMIQQELQTAEKYSNLTSEKIKGTLSRLRSEGYMFGRAKYGFETIKDNNGIRKHIIKNSERNNIDKIKRKYIEISNNFHNIIENSGQKKSIIAITKNVIRWCNREAIYNRKNESFTIRQIQIIVKS